MIGLLYATLPQQLAQDDYIVREFKQGIFLLTSKHHVIPKTSVLKKQIRLSNMKSISSFQIK